MKELFQLIKDLLTLARAKALGLRVSIEQVYTVECFRNGKLLWVDNIHNLVVTAGLTDILDKYFKGSTYTAAHNFGLKGTGTPDAADTMGSHATWSEVTDYDEATRPSITWGTVSAGSVNNSASKCVFTISGTVTVYGGFVVCGTGAGTKGATTGTLVGAGDFTGGSRAVVDNDVLNVTVTATLTAS